jgi:hypothetical protein
MINTGWSPLVLKNEPLKRFAHAKHRYHGWERFDGEEYMDGNYSGAEVVAPEMCPYWALDVIAT